MPYQKVLISVDNSELTLKVAEQGMNLSSQLGAEIAVVFVVDTAKINKDSESGSLPQHQIAKLKVEANVTMDQIAQKFPDCTFERYLPEGKPSKEIINIAKDWNADLIIMGTQRKTGLKRLLLGSTAENTIRLSDIPILIVPSSP